MSFGISVNNQDGIIQIDQDYKNPYLRHTASVATETIPSGTDYPDAGSHYKLTVPASLPVPAFYCNQDMMIYKCDKSGGDWTFTFICREPPGTPFTYYIFDTANKAPNTGFGLEVYTAGSEVAFSSENHYMRVVDVLSGTASWNDGPLSFNFPAGKTYAITQSRVPWELVTPNEFNSYFFGAYVKADLSSFVVSKGRVRAVAAYSGFPTFGDLDYYYLVLDVTGM